VPVEVLCYLQAFEVYYSWCTNRVKKNTSDGSGSPFAAAFANMLASSFLFRSMCSNVNPLNCFSRLHTIERYCMRTGSLAEQSFLIWSATILESILTMHVVTLGPVDCEVQG
jgi:hypothetical protein